MMRHVFHKVINSDTLSHSVALGASPARHWPPPRPLAKLGRNTLWDLVAAPADALETQSLP
jgi:hypothetical protein